MPPKIEFNQVDQDYFVAIPEEIPHRLFELTYSRGLNRWELVINKKETSVWKVALRHILYEDKLETKLALSRYLLINFDADMVWEP